MNPLERYGIEALICALLIFGIVSYLEHRGAAKVEAADAKVVEERVAKNQLQEAKDTELINQEAIAHDKSIRNAPDPTPALVCVRKYAAPRALSGDSAAAGVSNGTAQLPTTNRPSFDPGPALGAIGRDADAQVTELQSYIRDVCLAPQT